MVQKAETTQFIHVYQKVKIWCLQLAISEVYMYLKYLQLAAFQASSCTLHFKTVCLIAWFVSGFKYVCSFLNNSTGYQAQHTGKSEYQLPRTYKIVM